MSRANHPHQAGLLLVVAALGWLARPAPGAPDEHTPAYERATARVGRALILVAARNGTEAARRLAGPHLPARLASSLERAAASPAASDLRATGAGQLDLQGMLVPRLIADVADLSSSLVELATLGGARLAEELGELEREAGRLQSAAAELERSARTGAVPSRVACAALPAGPELLLLARGAPLLRDDLARTRGALPRYELLARILGRTSDPLARFLLDVAPRAAMTARAELRATGDRQGEVQALALQTEQRLDAAAASLDAAIQRAVAAVTRIRQEELNRTLVGARGSEMDAALVLFQGYKSQFGEPPDLEALPTWDVYADRKNGRLHVWLAGEGRWERGPERVDPLQPVIDALLGVSSPELRTLVVEPRALARLLVAFEVPLSEGLARLTAAAEQALAGAERIERAAGELGFDPGQVADALEARAGASLRLLGPPEARLVALRERALEAAVRRGPAASRDLLRALEAAATELQALVVDAVPIAIEGPGGALGEAVEVDLVWAPDPRREPGAWLIPPPERARSSRIAVLRVGAGREAGQTRVSGFALRGEQVLTGRVTLAAEGGSSLRLAPSAGPALVARAEPDPDGRLLVHQLPRASRPLWVWRTGPGAPRPLRPVAWRARAEDAAGWAWELAPGPGEEVGRWTLAGRDEQGAERARAEVELPARARVVLRAPAGAAPLVAGETCQAELRDGAGDEGREWTIASEAGVPLLVATGATLELPVDLPPGRYRVGVGGAEPAPFGVIARGSAPARVGVAVNPWLAPEVAAVHTGQGVCLRLECWPAVAPEELLQVEWTVRGGARELDAVTRPVPGAPQAALVLPLRIAAGARPGPRQVRARAHTARGVLEAEGRFEVAAGGQPVGLELTDARGEPAGGGGLAAAVALGAPEGLLRAGRELRAATWVLVGPAGTVRALVPRWDGQVPLALAEGDAPGPYEVWLSGLTPAGEPVHGRLGLLGYRPGPLEVKVPAAPQAGQSLRLELVAPAGYRSPFRVRLGRGAWEPGLALAVATQVENLFELELSDADGRRATTRLALRCEPPAGVESPQRYGIAADARERRVFAVEFSQLQNYRRSQSLPPTWAILEPGPLSASGVRDRLFQTVPFDGPADPADTQQAYRSVRFWGGLQESARARFAALDAPPDVPYAVQNSPSPGGETTLRELAARLLSERGGWEYRLARVELAAEGAAPDPAPARQPGEPVRFRPLAAGGEGGDLGRVVVDGPLGRLSVRPSLPATIALGREARVALTCAAERRPVAPGRPWPAGWEQLAPRAVQLLEVSARLRLDGEEQTCVARRVDPEQVGLDLGLILAALSTERAGQGPAAPRVAERVGVSLGALHQALEERPRRLLPAPPGQLDPQPRELVLEVTVRLVPALSPRDWPEGRPRPDALFVDAVPFLPESGDLPRTRVTLTATWLRAAREVSLPAAPPPLGDRSACLAPPADEDPAAALDRLEGAWPPGEEQTAAAARALRAALQQVPTEPRAWALLADVARREGRSLEAQNLARWAQACGPSPLAAVVELETLVANFRLEEARRCLERLGRLELSPALQRRVELARRALR